MFEDWSEYYLMIGSAGAVLIGLLFVVITLTSDRERSTVLLGASLYMSPIVLHCAQVLVVSAAALAPLLGFREVGLLCMAIALIGFMTSVRVVIGIRARRMNPPPHWSDAWWYGVVPGALYVGLAADAAGILMRLNGAILGLAATMLALLLVSIRNAWDLVIWLTPRPNGDLQIGENP